MRRLRAERAAPILSAGWRAAAGHWGAATTTAATALSAARRVPAPVVRGVTKVARAVVGADDVPMWMDDLPGGGTRRGKLAVSVPVSEADAIYIPSCQSAMFGPADGGRGLQRSFQDVCAAADIRLHIPEGIDRLCCGTPWSSKGFVGGKERMTERVVATVVAATRAGELPVVCDSSSCTEGFIAQLHGAATSRPIQVVDGVVFLRDRVLPRLGELPRAATVTVHPTCSSARVGSTPALLDLAAAVAGGVRVPDAWGCCAFAGDRGMLHPELTAAATEAQAREVLRLDSDLHASCNRTCEIGMTRATGHPYRGIIELVADAVRATSR